MTPSPTFRDHRRDRRERERRDRDRRISREERKDRRKSDVFKGSLSEGQTLQELEGGKAADVSMKDIEIPMDSDDEEAKIEELRKRREMRKKMMEKVVEQEDSPASSPASRVASPLEKVYSRFNADITLDFEKDRI